MRERKAERERERVINEEKGREQRRYREEGEEEKCRCDGLMPPAIMPPVIMPPVIMPH